jgi:uncharacterized protein YecT (DUF1311 family)
MKLASVDWGDRPRSHHLKSLVLVHVFVAAAAIADDSSLPGPDATPRPGRDYTLSIDANAPPIRFHVFQVEDDRITIQVFDGQGQAPIQVLSSQMVAGPWEGDDAALLARDVNCDGYADLLFRTQASPGGNATADAWTFEPASHRFRKNAALSNLDGGFSVDCSTRSLVTHWSLGYNEFTEERYRWFGSDLRPVERTSQTYDMASCRIRTVVEALTGNEAVVTSDSAQIDEGCIPTTQIEIGCSAGASAAAADDDLNDVYHAIIKAYSEDPTFLQSLKAAQRAWLKFRDAEIGALFPHGGEAGYYGSVKPMCEVRWRETLTRDRTEQLRRWLKGAVEDDVCRGSIKPSEQLNTGSPAETPTSPSGNRQ